MKLDHVKSVKRGKQVYLYFNTGQKVDGKPIYTPLGKKGDPDVGTRYSTALQARSRRTGDPSGLLMPQLVGRFQRSPEFVTKKSAGTQKTYGVYLRRLEHEFNTAPAAGIESSDILNLMDTMAARPAAVDMLLMVGNMMFEWAKKRKLVHHNPFAEIDREDWEQRQYEPWPEEVLAEALLDAKLRLPVALLYYTAQRIGDCCNIRWDDVTDGELRVVQQKTKKELFIPLHSELEAILAETPRAGDTIMVGPKGKKAKDQTIRGWIKAFGADRGLDLVPHGLRKNAVNALLEAGCSTGEVSAISGQTLGMVEHYARRRNSRRMGKSAVAKWEQNGARKTTGKTVPESTQI